MLRSLTFILMFLAVPASAQQAATQAEAAKPADEINQLIDILENETARNALIQRLRDGADKPAAPKATPAPQKKLTFSRRVAQATQDAAESVMQTVSSISVQMQLLPKRLSNLDGSEITALWEVLKNLALIIAITVGLYILLRNYSKYIYRHLNDKAQTARFGKRLWLWASAGLVDLATLIATWAAGYGVGLLLTGDPGQIGIRQTMFLNAFLLVGAFKVVIRLFITPSAPELRLLPINSRQAGYLSRRISWIAGILGYGQLLVVPVINANASYSSAQLVSTLIAMSVLVYLIWISIRNRASVARWLAEDNDADSPEFQPSAPSGFLARLASFWHIPVILYLVTMLIMVAVRPPSAVFQSFISSGQMVLVVMFGITLSRFLSRITENGIPVPESLSQKVPLLQSRLNRFLPTFLNVFRYLIMILAVMLMLDAVEAIDLPALLSSPLGLKLMTIVLAVMMVLFVSFMIWVVLNAWVDYRLNPSVGKVASARETTLMTLFRNAATIALLIITLMFVLSEIGLDIAPLLASAGVLGLAIGFGAQKMVQDIITGIFIQIENAMNVGDTVTVGSITGKVEKLTVRSVSIRDPVGAYHILPFSSVDMVTSYARDFCYFLCDMGVGYSEDADKVKTAMQDAFAELVSVPDYARKILGEMEWHGLQSFGDSAVVFRIKIKCTPGDHWGIGRAYNGILKRIFDERNIEIPFPHQTIFFGESGDKSDGPARLTGQEQPQSS
ncbi:MAG: mechanosensitive ion channel protein MscS [Rhodobacterales bacterium]|nr:MAG: mechanosensitive ion channel protein MscS [Rhodobacterales bacterium]